MEIKKDFYALKKGTKFRSEKGGRAYVVLGNEYVEGIEGVPVRWTLDVMSGRKYPASFDHVWIDDGFPEKPQPKKTILIKKA